MTHSKIIMYLIQLTKCETTREINICLRAMPIDITVAIYQHPLLNETLDFNNILRYEINKYSEELQIKGLEYWKNH